MPVRYFADLENIYNTQITVKEGTVVGNLPKDSFAQPKDTVSPGKYFDDTDLNGVDGHNNITLDPKKLDKPSIYNKAEMSQSSDNEKKNKKVVKKESKQINNSTMKEKHNKSSFDRLFEDVMGDEGFSNFDDDGSDESLGGGDEVGGDEFGGGGEGEDVVTLELPRDLASQLHQALMDQLGDGEEDDLGDDLDVEDLPGEEGEDLQPESHVDIQAVPDSVSKLAGHNNKVGGSANPGGGSADGSSHGQEDGGKPKVQSDAVGKLVGKGNKVGGKVSGGNKDLFKA
mgnify:CR=1 FL=1|tara:strand:- start:185 stop:1039 length:855 start_codon:yes stop_codon:yes gene_type:complete